MKMKITESTFKPVNNLQGKKNYKEQFTIFTDGIVKRRILLNIPDQRQREEIILKHFLKQYVYLFIKRPISVNIIERDNPWDFRINLGKLVEINIEITAISDDLKVFRRSKHEELFDLIKDKKEIRVRDLVNLKGKISPDLVNEDFLSNILATHINQDDIIVNPFYGGKITIWMSSKNYQSRSFDECMWKAINSKTNKRHKDKDNTVLIIDNRSINYELSDITSFISNNRIELANTLFMEIWFYTGYYSDHRANDCEFSLIPLKLTMMNESCIKLFSEINRPDQDGITYMRKWKME
jgi:hypothetical protein